MRVVFMGSAPLSCQSLEVLLKPGSPANVVGVISQPDRPRGRNLVRAPSPVKALALRAGVPTASPEDVNSADSLKELEGWKPDCIVVVAFGQMLKATLLGLPPRGCVNLHASLLPKYRGAAPIQWAIANGETVTGVTTMYMVRRMDAGDILRQREEPIRPEDTAGSLHDRLAVVGAALLAETLDALAHGGVTATPQDDSRVTFAPKIRKEDGKVDWTLPARWIHNRLRAFDPWPGTYCRVGAVGSELARLKILRACVEDGMGDPGRVLEISGAGVRVGTGGGTLRLLDVQPEGKRSMGGAAYAHGHRLKIGDQLE